MSADTERLLPPNDSETFESLCLDLWREIWGDPGAQKNGRSGQPQAGVDLFGRERGVRVGVQCKQQDGLVRRALGVRELDKEVVKARAFVPRLGRFIVAISGPRDGKLQERARELSEPGFDVQIWSWEDIWHELYQRRELLARILPVYWPMQSALRKRRVSPSRLRHAAGRLYGRETELAALDAAWTNRGINIISIVAWGGVGKTALVSKWGAALAARAYDGADYFDWSFYSQGTREHGVSADPFIDAALRFFGDGLTADSAQSPWDKGSRLAQLVAEKPTLLVLDGMEPLQHPSGPLAGELKDPALTSLVRGLAGNNSGLCLITTRQPVKDLTAFEESTAPRWELDHLPTGAGVEFLKSLRVYGSRADLEALVGDVRGHALTLSLVGRFLHAAYGGDVRRRDLVRFEEADAEVQGSHGFKVMEAYQRWFASDHEQGEPLLALLHLLGLFDRPAAFDLLEVLRRPPAIPGLTETIVGMSDPRWNLTLTRLVECGLVVPNDGALDAHPLVREHFGRQLREGDSDAWKAAHGRLFDHLQRSTDYQPNSLDGLQPLYQAVAHGCQAGRQREAFETYHGRILDRFLGGSFFSTRKLGAFNADLGAVACFFEPPWSHVSSALDEPVRGWLLNLAGLRLRALGRIVEAIEPMRAALQMGVDQENWQAAAIRAGNLSEINLTLGDLAGAARDAEQSLEFAERIEDRFHRMMGDRTLLANVLHQAGSREEALSQFRKAEAIQAQSQMGYPFLYSVRGFRYCDLLLGVAERAAGGRPGLDGAREACDEVEQRVEQTLDWASQAEAAMLTIALDQLTLGRARLYRAILQGVLPNKAEALIDRAVEGLRRAGALEFVVCGLLTRAWLRSALGEVEGACVDLAEAHEIAEHGPMPLLLADAHLYRARLLRDRAALTEARRLVENHSYGRRREELEDLEAVPGGW